MQCEHDQVVVINAHDIHQAQRDLLDRSPGQGDRIDYERIERTAAQAHGYRHSPSRLEIEFFDVERAGGLADNPFYQWAQRRGYALHLTERGQGERWEHEAQLLEHLRGLRENCACPLVFVGGGFRSPHIRTELLSQADRRDLSIICFSRWTEFQAHELEHFASLSDLVKISAAGKHHYKRLTELGRADSERADSSDLVLAASVGDELGVIGHALTEQAPQVFPALELDPESEGEISAEQARAPDQAYVECVDEPDPWLILIDLENNDGTLYEMLNGILELNQETRAQWQRLPEWVKAHPEMGETLVVPVLQASSPSVAGFASHLAYLGFRPVLLDPEPSVKVVDEAIMQLLKTMQRRYGNVMLISNDGDFYEHLETLRNYSDSSERHICVAGFVDRMSQRYVKADWIEVFDLERDLGLFDYPLPNRYLPIRLAEFNAAALLDECSLFDLEDDPEAA